jgi:ubiquinone/menaquinone biosynthesis C-methylase UbiE
MQLSKLCGNSPVAEPKETELWHAAYGADDEIRRRRRALPTKLHHLGIDAAPHDVAILDLCCGHGETLDCLHGLGFSKLQGLDLRIDDRLALDRRFQVTVGDALDAPYADRTFDWVLLIHSLHHFGDARRVAQFLAEGSRILKPGGRLGIVDFPASPQIRLAFWFFRQNRFLCTSYLRTFGQIIQEEWPFLREYLPQWPEVRRLLLGGRFQVERLRRRLFYFYLTLRKPL